jgi:quercetin dioxygenase-like cupin family protein
MPLVNLDDLKELDLAEGITARVVHAGNVSIAHAILAAGSILPEHAHPHEQVVNVMDGELELTVEGKTTTLGRGKAMVLPPMVPHSGVARSDCYVVDVFHPVREDFRAMAEGKLGSRPYDKD